jgi:hypothetical protein
MLIDITTKKKIARMPHEQQFDEIKARLSAVEFDAVIAEINARIDAAGGEIATAGWLPGSDWSGTPFAPIYEKGCRRNQRLSGLFFGQCVWFAMSERPEPWAFGRYQKDGIDIGSITYFRVDPGQPIR